MNLRTAIAEQWARIRRCAVPVTPRELSAARFGPRILVVSIPKAGTHLVTGLLDMLPNVVRRWHHHYPDNELPGERPVRGASVRGANGVRPA